MTKFTEKYVGGAVDKRDRDRFQVEYNEEERQIFANAMVFIQQSKDATAVKQLALLGVLALSNQNKFAQYLRDTLLKNERNNKRLGVNVRTELESKFPRLRLQMGGKLQSWGRPDE